MRQKGFTLIELLVVIAIIGILASIVLASLNTARDKGADAAIKGNLNGVRAQAELYFDSNANTYGTAVAVGTCPTSGTTMFYADSNIKQAIESAERSNGSGIVRCAALDNAGGTTNPAQSWAVAAQLKTNSAQSYCIDSGGNATTTSNATPIAAVSNNARCQ